MERNGSTNPIPLLNKFSFPKAVYSGINVAATGTITESNKMLITRSFTLLWYISKAYPAIEQTITLIIVPITAYLIELMKSTVKALLLKRVFKLLKRSMPGSNHPAAMSVLELVTDINIK